jgi:hypothetical protein
MNFVYCRIVTKGYSVEAIVLGDEDNGGRKGLNANFFDKDGAKSILNLKDVKNTGECSNNNKILIFINKEC